ncbi:hypothetical protein ACIGEP_11065 [Microbacterium sp. NPDC077663]|uniref:hypothetical protein n=1 Tax=Microbacterium sp. NPDC077663 TaxID=3364189 RepID=UPI0037CA69C9
MDELISPAGVDTLRESLKSVVRGLDTPQLDRVRRSLDGLRLRDRVNLVRDAALADVPAGFPAAEGVVDGLLRFPQTTGWIIWPLSEFVTARALEDGSESAFDAAMSLLARLTTRLSSEFAIRDMLIARPERALAHVGSWLGHENEHVRRLASEGTRSHLPWAKKVPWLLEHPDATGPIIDALYRDPAEYVRRSVANHLNDLSRLSPDVATGRAQAWAVHPDEHTARVIRHGMRTLVKRADPTALALVGYSGDRLRVERPQLDATVVPHEGSVTFRAEVTNEGDADAVVAIDYTIGFRRARGSLSPKTFKLASRTLAPGASVTVTKTHSFRRITTRSHHPGRHVVTVQANGVRSPEAEFILESDDRSDSTPA